MPIKAINFIEANLKEDIRVDDVAREAFYSQFHFTRKFLELKGETPGSYLRRRRLEEAPMRFWMVQTYFR